MPVGKVFDAAANQVLISPVSNFYQGKAIRQQLAAGEQDAELKGLQIELAKDEVANAPSAREAARRMSCSNNLRQIGFFKILGRVKIIP